MSTAKNTITLPNVPFRVCPKKPSPIYEAADKKSNIVCTVKGGIYTVVSLSENNLWGLLGSGVGYIYLSDFRVLK